MLAGTKFNPSKYSIYCSSIEVLFLIVREKDTLILVR